MLINQNIKKKFLLMLIVMVMFLPIAGQQETLFKAAAEESAKSAQAAPLQTKIEAILNDVRIDGAITGVSIRKAETGEVLYSHLGDTRLRPASNMKLLTAAAALETLGTEYQFTTEVLTDGDVKGKVLHGNVYLKGKGDPTLLKADFDQFARDLKAKGIDKIKGNLISDDSWYDDVRLSQDLNWSDETNYTGAQVSALTISPNEDYDAGTVIVEVGPAAEIGGSAKVQLTPATGYVTIINNARTVAQNEPKKISINREHGTNNIIIEGTMPINGTNSRSWVAVWEPAGYALDIFKKSLEENGLSVIGNAAVKTGVTPNDANMLTYKKSMPLKELLVPFMKLSNNGHAETLTKEMGKAAHGEGSWEKGLQVIEETVKDLKVDGGTIRLRDGSGMSHKSLIPADELTQLLHAVQDKDWFPVFENSLPVAGVSDRMVGGTLRSRMKKEPTAGNVKAKTGSLNGVSALSGYVSSKDGEKLIFSIMINNYISSSVTQIEDAIVTELAEHSFRE
ncbi:D-alanyl-D-alanine carboxypeptidase/D-alanyl-D-alanine endopeptidase [Bacillus sp. T33-2]|uniref:D-alanyl-D-alanine carboxypeptidase/D-alanyl-D-alanine endopeptidase n=1 Tax=Bacillus sp. T33-2 TaxID=2054168 RepID=UPI000C75D897|nr:D-alanyl-D-alanine carboxypeptidase/D-alanyl-D-alanine-endopeptidase [Bacillus sp. T33-2]PLR99254.1 D-alanyl-D-alanine carboxypeptidase/D-alanyl-D-alanine-endopeptidase [Bacillus sp. T33-2]